MTTPPFEHLDGLIIGRDEEVRRLRSAYQRVVESQSCEAVLIHGDSGTGKTTLVQHSFQSQHDNGTMIRGKFDVIHSQRPYSAIVDALTQLCQMETWVNISDEDDLQTSLSKRFSPSDLNTLFQLVPTVEQRLTSLFVSDENKVESSSEFEQLYSNDKAFAFARFAEVVRSFLFMVARSLSSPLILFLDDVQAADAESLSLISSLTSLHSESCNLLLVLAYRDSGDSEPKLPQNKFLSHTTVFEVTNIEVGVLEEESVNIMISKLLRMDPDETMPLSCIIAQRTGGNMYFAQQFLEVLKNDKLLGYRFESFRWEWNLEKIRADTNVTDNMAWLLTSKIQQLPPNVQTVIQLAACLGFYFDIQFLERLFKHERTFHLGLSLHNLPNALGGSSDDVKIEGEVKHCPESLRDSDSFSQLIAIAVEEHLIDQAWGSKYKFAHDRVMLAVYEMIPSGSVKKMLHWRIGQVLWSDLNQQYQHQQQPSHLQEKQSFSKTSADWLLFTAADQLNRGSDVGLMTVDDGVTALDLARLNLEAGKAAIEKSAFKHAAGFFDKGVKLIEKRWQFDYSLCLELHTLSAETEYAASNFEKCDQRIAEILVNGRSLEDKLRAYLIKVQSQGVRGNILEAMDEAVAVLRMLGEPIPRRPNLLQLLCEIGKTKKLLKKTEIADLVSLPVMTNPLKIWAIKFLQNIALFAWCAGQARTRVMSGCRMMQLTANYGVSSQGAYILGTYGVILGYLGDLEAAFQFGRAAMELTKRTDIRVSYARAVPTVCAFLDHLKQPMTRSLERLMTGYNAGIKTGEIQGAALCLSGYAFLGIVLGKNLNVVDAEMQGFRQAYRDEINRNFTMASILPWHQLVLNLTGRSENPLKLDGDIMCEESYLKEERRTGNAVAIATLNVARMMLLYVLGDIEAASEEVGKLDMSVVSKGTHFATPFLLMYAALIMLAMARETRKRKFLKRASVFTGIMQKFAKAGNLNMPPMLELISAELVNLKRNTPHEVSKRAYENAVRMASQSGFSVVEAIGNERAAQYMLSIGDSFWAETYLSRAFLLYNEWGATTKTKNMVERYSFLAQSDCRALRRNSVSIVMRKRFSYQEVNERRQIGI